MYDPFKHNRKSLRLKNYDYSKAGYYFVTICTENRLHLFGEIVKNNMILNECGIIVEKEWFRTPKIRPYVQLDAFVIMPNHLHGVIILTDNGGVSRDGDGSHGGDVSNDGGVSDGGDGLNDDAELDGRGELDGGESYRNAELDGRGVLQYAPTGDGSNGGAYTDSGLRSPSHNLGSIIRGFKGAVTTEINKLNNTPGNKIWQRNYYERIIRNEQELYNTRYYISTNPENWAEDVLNSQF